MTSHRPPVRRHLIYAARAIIAALIATISACGPPPAARRADVEAYLQRMAAWAPIEAETARTLERILDTQFVDEAEVIRQIADNSPRVRSHLTRIQDYEPRTEDVRAVHATYIEAWRRLLAGYEDIENGFRTGEASRLANGREAFAIWRDALVTTAKRLTILKDETGAKATALQSS